MKNNNTIASESNTKEEKRYVSRLSTHIQEDIKRGWSSYNFGQSGVFFNSHEDLIEAIINSEDGIYISECYICKDNYRKFEFGELYEGYWVVVDTDVCGISGINLNAETLVEAIEEAKNGHYFGDGIAIDLGIYDLVCSIDYNADHKIHIFELKD